MQVSRFVRPSINRAVLVDLHVDILVGQRFCRWRYTFRQQMTGSGNRPTIDRVGVRGSATCRDDPALAAVIPLVLGDLFPFTA